MPIISAKNTTIKDVAKDAGVSIKSVSRVVNNEPAVSEELRAKVEESIKKLNFKPNEAARRMRAQKSYLIGFPMPVGNYSYYNRLLESALEACNGSNYNILIQPLIFDSLPDSEMIIAALQEMVIKAKVEGIMLPGPYCNDEKIHAWLLEHKIPYASVAQISSFKSKIYTTFDIAMGITAITQHLIDLGHRRIAFISGPEKLLASVERKRAFYETLQHNNIDADPRLYAEGDFSFSKGLDAAQKILTQINRPTAIVCANDLTAIGAMQTAHKLGIHIPYDLSITGFDDIPEAKINTIPLTTVHQPLQEMATASVTALIHYLATGKMLAFDPIFECELVVRGSTKALR